MLSFFLLSSSSLNHRVLYRFGVPIVIHFALRSHAWFIIEKMMASDKQYLDTMTIWITSNKYNYSCSPFFHLSELIKTHFRSSHHCTAIIHARLPTAPTASNCRRTEISKRDSNCIKLIRMYKLLRVNKKHTLSISS